ncbi:MAG: peroxidase-related enzyme, partial [Ignavibacteriae bacterium]|nr:peroxidase-related enzyme [Ignavibacteriota bacterium]
YELAQTLLRAPSTLSEAERELIATYVSSRNECVFCTMSHAAAARILFGDASQTVDDVLKNPDTAPVSDKFKALIVIAGKVQKGGRIVTDEDIENARKQGATDMEIHDTVLIAATFSMFNRYVDGLASFTPTSPEEYAEMGKRMVAGYVMPPR